MQELFYRPRSRSRGRPPIQPRPQILMGARSAPPFGCLWLPGPLKVGEGVREDPEELEHEDGWHEALAEQGAVSAIVVLVEPVEGGRDGPILVRSGRKRSVGRFGGSSFEALRFPRIREGGENSLQVRVVEEVGARCVDGSEGRQSVEPGHREQPEGHAAHQSNDLLQPVKGVEELIL